MNDGGCALARAEWGRSCRSGLWLVMNRGASVGHLGGEKDAGHADEMADPPWWLVRATYLFIRQIPPASCVRPCRLHVHRRLCGGMGHLQPAWKQLMMTGLPGLPERGEYRSA